MPEIPTRAHLDAVYLHVFFGSGDSHLVQDQTINEIYAGSGTYRLVPPAAYDIAYAFSTRDLFITNAATDAQYHNVYTLEPISGIITLLFDAPYPPQIKVSYRFYGSYQSIRVKDLQMTWPSPPAFQDVYDEGVFPLQSWRQPTNIRWSIYGTNINAIKSYIREGVKRNNFFLIIDDNICDRTWDADSPALFRPGWAAEGPIYMNDIDLVDRGGEPTTDTSLKPHKYGDYYWHTTITPDATERWWPAELGGEWGWDYWKNPNHGSILTPPVGYAYPATDPVSLAVTWWTASTIYSRVYTGGGPDDITINLAAYTGPDNRLFNIVISGIGAPDTFQMQYSDDGGASYSVLSPAAGENITGAPQAFPVDDATGFNEGPGILITIPDGTHNLNDHWTFGINSRMPVGLPALSMPPGGYIIFRTNLPPP